MIQSYKKISLATKIPSAMIIGSVLGYLLKGSFGVNAYMAVIIDGLLVYAER